MNRDQFAEVVAKLRDARARSNLEGILLAEKPVEVDVTSLGLNNDGSHPDTQEVIEDVAQSILQASVQASIQDSSSLTEDSSRDSAYTINPNSSDSYTSSFLPGVAREITLNDKQQAAKDLILSGRSCVLVGSAGTGKTTSMRSISRALIEEKLLPPMQESTKWLRMGLPGGVILSFTNKAVNNIRHAVVDELKPHTITAHKLLEFKPEYFEIEDPNNEGSFKKTMRFSPTKTAVNPLPASLCFIAWEESSMISVQLYNLVKDAMPHAHQEIFLGDIQQLPPVFGLAVLGFKMLELPVIELTEIYRQAAGSPIIELAWKILGKNITSEDNNKEFNPDVVFSSAKVVRTEPHPVTGKVMARNYFPALEALTKETPAGKVVIQPWQNPLESETAVNAFSQQVITWLEKDPDYYNPEEDIILCPFNKAFGTIEINKKISYYLGRKRNAVVWEVIAGIGKHYLAVGDRVLYDKEDAVITNINHNGNYMGKEPQIHSEHLDRWGHHRQAISASEAYMAKQDAENRAADALDQFFSTNATDDGDRVHAASHVVTVQLKYSSSGDGDREIILESASDINNLLGGYAITVHKAQGSEYPTVILALHNSHAKMNSRELLYTAVTRARDKLHIICESDTFLKGFKSQRIKGNTLKEKAEFFNGENLNSASASMDIDRNVVKAKVKVKVKVDPEPEPKPEPKPEPISIPKPKPEPKPISIQVPQSIADKIAAIRAKFGKS